MKLVIDIPDYTYEELRGCKGVITIGEAIVITQAIKNGTPLPQNPTNGDIIKAMFPNVEVKEKNNVYEIYFGVGTCIQHFNHQWWNAPYKRGEEDADSN